MSFVKVKQFFKNRRRYVILFSVLAVCVLVHIITRLSHSFSDFLNFGLSMHLRAFLSAVNSIFPFSLSETVLLMLPLLLLGTPVYVIFNSDKAEKLLFILCTVLVSIYGLFVMVFAPAYSSTPADKLFGLDDSKATAEDLESSAYILTEEINALADSIDYSYGSFSKMGMDLNELGSKLSESYDALHTEYPFIKNFTTRLKPIALSEALTYTHISGVYAYYTGESNINVNFPDYTLPYTSAHEMAHARGFARENEANFVAFLVCESSEDPYVKYSGKLNMLEYIINALAPENPALAGNILGSLDPRVYSEMVAYSNFFTPYMDSTASEVASAVNDTVLKSQGVAEGEKSYGLVIDLACAYILGK